MSYFGVQDNFIFKIILLDRFILKFYLNFHRNCQSKQNNLNSFGGINPVNTSYANPTRELFLLRAGYTGIILALIFYIMITTAAVPIRRSFFEVFWYSHHIFVFIYPVLHFHGSGHVIKEQTNLQQHDPELCSQPQNLEIWGETGNFCPVPEYTGKRIKIAKAFTQQRSHNFFNGEIQLYTVGNPFCT